MGKLRRRGSRASWESQNSQSEPDDDLLSAFVSYWLTFYLPVCIGSKKKRGIARASQGYFIESFKFLVNNTKATQRRQQIACKCGPMRTSWMITGTRSGLSHR